MEIGLPNTQPSSTGMNQGYAQVLDQSSFDPVAFTSNIVAYRQAKEAEKAKQALENRAKWAKVGQPKVDYVTEYNKKELEDAINQYGEVVTQGMTQGIDPEYDQQFKTQLQGVQMGIDQLQTMSKQMDDIVKSYQAEAPKHDPKVWEEWKAGLDKQPTIQDRFEYVTKKNPFEEQVDIVELIGNAIDPKTLQEISQIPIGNGATTTRGVTRDARLKEQLDLKLFNNPALQSQIDRAYQQGLGKQWNNADEFAEYVFKTGKQFALPDYKKTTAGWKPSSDNNLEFGFGGDNKFGDVVINAGGQQVDESIKNFSSEDAQSKGTTIGGVEELSGTILRGGDLGAGVFSIAYDANKQAPEGNFLTANGQSVQGRPTAFKFSQDGSIWAYVGDALVPVQMNDDVIKVKEVKDNAKANQEQMKATFQTDDFKAVLRYMYDKKGKSKKDLAKEGKTTTKTETPSSPKTITKAEWTKLSLDERLKLKNEGVTVQN